MPSPAFVSEKWKRWMGSNGIPETAQTGFKKQIVQTIDEIVKDLFHQDDLEPGNYLKHDKHRRLRRSGQTYLAKAIENRILGHISFDGHLWDPHMSSANAEFLRNVSFERKKGLKIPITSQGMDEVGETGHQAQITGTQSAGTLELRRSRRARRTPEHRAGGYVPSAVIPDTGEEIEEWVPYLADPDEQDERDHVAEQNQQPVTAHRNQALREQPRRKRRRVVDSDDDETLMPITERFSRLSHELVTGRSASDFSSHPQAQRHATVTLTCMCETTETLTGPIVKLSTHCPRLEDVRTSLSKRDELRAYAHLLATAKITAPAELGKTESKARTPIDTDEDLEAWLDRESPRPLCDLSPNDRVSIKQPLTIHIRNKVDRPSVPPPRGNHTLLCW